MLNNGWLCVSQHNETHRDWKMQAVVCGEGFSGPKVVNVPAGTKACYPLTFHPSAQCIVMVMILLLWVFCFFLSMCLLLSHSCFLICLLYTPRQTMQSLPCAGLELLCIHGDSASSTLRRRPTLKISCYRYSSSKPSYLACLLISLLHSILSGNSQLKYDHLSRSAAQQHTIWPVSLLR